MEMAICENRGKRKLKTISLIGVIAYSTTNPKANLQK